MRRQLYASWNRFQRRRLTDKRAGVAAIETIICSAACLVPWFREPEHHPDRASLATRFAGQVLRRFGADGPTDEQMPALAQERTLEWLS